MRADFHLVRGRGGRAQAELGAEREGTPFAHLLKSADTEVRLERRREPATEVTIELRQTLNGFFSRFGGYMVRRAAAATIEEALDGLERISG